MKIAIFTDTYYPETNGVSKTLQRLVLFLKDHGHLVKVVAPAYDTMELTDDYLLLPGKPLSFYPACQVVFPKMSVIEDEMESFSPELIHLATPAGIGLTGRKYALNKGIPLVASYHTNFDQYLVHYGLDILEPFYWMYLRWFHGVCRRNFCPSLPTLKKLEDNGFRNLLVWGRGIDSENFNPKFRSDSLRASWGGLGKKILLYVGRLAKEKNVGILFEAYDLLDEATKKQVIIVIVGQGPDSERLKAIGPDNTIFTGMLSGELLSQAYASCDIFTFTSATETFGNVILEAFASGLPVISPRAGGVLESLREGDNAFGYEPGDRKGFAINIERLVKDDSLRLGMSQRARQFALERSWDDIFTRLVNHYRETVSETYSYVI